MRCGSGLVWLAVACQALPCGGAPRVQTVDARWEEIRPLILNLRVEVSGNDGTVAVGVVEQVAHDHILLRVSSAAGASAAATQSVLRGSVETIKFQRVQGRGRVLWSTLLGCAGATLGVLIGARETFGEDGGADAVAAAAAIAAGGAAAGYAIGQRRDTRTMIIRIVP